MPEIEFDIAGLLARMGYTNGAELLAVNADALQRTLSRIITSSAGWQRATSYTWDKVGNLVAIGSVDDKLPAVYAYNA